MNLDEYKVLFLVVTAVVALLVASPALQRVLVYPQTEFFTELWLLGSGRMAEDFPFIITRGVEYSVFLGVANHLGECGYYLVEVKFLNATQSAPNSFNRTASTVEPVYGFNVFVADEESLELPLSFSFDYVWEPLNENVSQVRFASFALNGVSLSLGGLTSVWDEETDRFFGNLVFELWIYDGTVGAFQYHERFVDLKFNMTVAA